MKPELCVVSLGPGDPELMNVKTIGAIRNAETLILRTGRHPAAEWLDGQGIVYETLDPFYEEAEDFDELNREAAAHILRMSADKPVVYAVPDACSDLTVRALFRQAEDRSRIRVIPGVGAADQFLSSSIPLMPDGPLTIASACGLISSGSFDPNHSLLVTELDNPIQAGQVKILLSAFLEDEHSIFLIRGSCAPVPMPLYQLDRESGIDHRTAVFVPGSDFLSRERFVMRDLSELMDRLRAPDGCPWDRAQTHESLEPYMIEEAWECVAAIDQEDPDHLCEELGDLLFQVVFHASVGASFDEFTLGDVITAVCRKMIRRHPHVFGGRDLKDAGSVRTAWEQIKREETGRSSAVDSLDDVSEGLPSLKYAARIFKKLDSVQAVHRTPAQILDAVVSLTDHIRRDPEAADRSELGRLLLSCTELCFRLGADGELILRQTADRLKNDLKSAEKLIIRDGKSLEALTFGELCVYLKHVEGEIE